MLLEGELVLLFVQHVLYHLMAFGRGGFNTCALGICEFLFSHTGGALRFLGFVRRVEVGVVLGGQRVEAKLAVATAVEGIRELMAVGDGFGSAGIDSSFAFEKVAGAWGAGNILAELGIEVATAVLDVAAFGIDRLDQFVAVVLAGLGFFLRGDGANLVADHGVASLVSVKLG